jgi:ubiquinone/menaquinone biosynthesis C-methylase UbiE
MLSRKIAESVATMDEIETYYDERSKGYDEIFGILIFRVLDTITWKYLAPYVPTNPDALVLDAGGGTGRWTVLIAGKGCKVVLIDASEGMLKIAAKKIGEEGLRRKIIIKKGDITQTGYANETFDMIFSEQTFFLFKEPDVLLKELYRVLKKKGRLVISAHNRYVQSLASLSENPTLDDVDNACKLWLRERYSCMTVEGKVKIYTWTPGEFREMLERNGFHVEKIMGKGMTMPLRISKDMFMKKEYSGDLFNRILQLELPLCERPDALALAGHLQAIVYKP